MVPEYKVCTTNRFQTTFAQWGEVNPLVEVTVNSMEENSEDFCPNYVQEFGLRGHAVMHTLHTSMSPNSCAHKYVAKHLLSDIMKTDTCGLIHVARCTWPEVHAWYVHIYCMDRTFGYASYR